MDWFNQLSNISYWAIIAATVSTFVVGSLWYAWGFFGQTWAGLVGLTKEEVEKPEPMVYLWTTIGSLISALVLAVLMRATNTTEPLEGLFFGLILGLAFRVTAHKMHNDFAHHPNQLTMIDGLHDVLQMGVMGLIIALFI
jgi:FtsH-binding integral membrane protein